jgi:hypothetical protein
MADTDLTQDNAPFAQEEQQEKQVTQVAYRPHSKGMSISTVCPPTMATPMSVSLDRVEAVMDQSIDEFVAERLGIDQETLFQRYAAEQIDCLSIAYLNQDRGRPTLIANDTGTGKGRIVSGVLSPVLADESKIAVFITAKPDLYVDMLARDMVDTGISDQVRPFFTNAKLNLKLTSPDGELLGVIETPQPKTHEKATQELIDTFKETGTLGEYNCIFTTYDQLAQKGSSRRKLIETIAPKATFVLDECDLGGGASGPTPPLTKKEIERKGRGEDVRKVSTFLTESVLPNSDAYVLLSATAFKDPFVLSRLMYPKSEIRETGLSQETLAENLVAQGIPGQQDFTNKLALSGEIVRLEKSMEGITFQTEAVPVSLELVDAASNVMSKLVQFDRAKQDAVDSIREEYAGDGSAVQGEGDAPGVDSVNFTSTAYNFQQQFLFFLKADSIAQRAIGSIEAGRKPGIIFFNTMQSVLEEYLGNKREDIEQDVARELKEESPDERVDPDVVKEITKSRYQEWLKSEPSPEITLNLGDLLERQLDKSRMVTIKDAYGERERHYLTDEELGGEALALDNEIRLLCQNTNWGNLKISGVDSIIQKVEEAGYTMAEMSGRSVGIDYRDGVPRYQEVNAKDPELRARAKNGFNNGENDGLLTNITTGWSGHASRSVSDQRQRETILAQAHPDGNKLMQSLGRFNRVGQVNPAKHQPDWTDDEGNPGWGQVREKNGIKPSFGLPIMTMLYADGVAYEERITANINRKMASLNANTTGARNSGGVKLGDVDFLNRYGDQVAWDLMNDDPELHKKLDFPLGEPVPVTEKIDGAMLKVTGRSLLLPLDEQHQLFETLKQNFAEFIAQREAIGESPMEAKTLDLQAKTIGRIEVMPAKSDSLFAGATHVEVVHARSLRKPYTEETVANLIRKTLEMPTDEALAPDEFEPTGDSRTLGQAAMESRIAAIKEQVTQRTGYLETVIDQKEKEREEKEPPINERIEALKTRLSELKEVPEGSELTQEATQEIKALEKDLKRENRILNKVYLDTNTTQEKGQLDTIQSQWKNIKERLEVCPVGQPVRIHDKELGAVYGIVTDVQRAKGIKNDLAGGAWKIKFAIADGSRELTLKLSDINTDKKVWVDKVEVAVQYNPPFERVPVHQMFGELQRERIETRQIVTGNLLAAPLGKKYINFTNNHGQVRQGLLLPRGYDIEATLAKMPVPLKTREHQAQFLEMASGTGAKLQTSDEALNIRFTVRSIAGQMMEGLLLEVPSSKKGGGQYFKDADLMALTDSGEFEKKGKVMQGFILNHRIEQFLDVLQRKFPDQYLVISDENFKPMTREVSGSSLQMIEWFKEDQPLDLAAKELEFSTEGIAEKITQLKEASQLKAETERQNRAIESGDLDAAKPAGEAERQEVQQHPDLAILIDAFESHFTQGGRFDRITEARKFAVSTLQQEGSDLDLTLTNKQVDECIEKALVRVAREITQSSPPLESFDRLVDLYDRQPNLSSRTSTSIMNQQYSTPTPLGRLVQQLADISPERSVYEPTAGNGSLITNANPERAIVNEIDSKRASELEAQGFSPTTHDATEYALEKKSVERVVLNPPFGAVRDLESGQSKRWLIELDDPAPRTRAYQTSAVDHAISFKALSAMQDDGKAVLVLGAPMEQKMGYEANAAYNEGQTRSFFYTLYNNYNVTDHFTVSGELYQKQGTSFPIDVVVIEGRGKSELPLPAVQPPPVLRSWEELRGIMQEAVGQEMNAPTPPIQTQVQAEPSPTINPAPEEVKAEETPRPFILPATEQSGGAEKNVARLLHKAGLVEAIAKAPEGDFHIKIENEPFIPLVVERHSDQLYLTHYLEDDFGDLFMDAEMVFRLNEGKLDLQEVATQNLRGGENRGYDRGFAKTFSSNLNQQGFAEAAQTALSPQQHTDTIQDKTHLEALPQPVREELPQVAQPAMDHQPSPVPPTPEKVTALVEEVPLPQPAPTREETTEIAPSVEVSPLVTEISPQPAPAISEQSPPITQPIAAPSIPEQVAVALQQTNQVLQQHDPKTAEALQRPVSEDAYQPSLKALRLWFRSAKEVGRDTSQIAAIAQQVIEGTPEADKPKEARDPNFSNPVVTLRGEALEVMKSDISAAREKAVVTNCRRILRQYGKPTQDNPDRIEFAKAKGDLLLSYDRTTQTLTAFSRAQNKKLLTAVKGQVQGETEDIKFLNKRTSQFLERKQQKQQSQMA